MDYQLNVDFFDNVKEFIDSLPEIDGKKIAASITAITEGNFESVFIKQLRGEIKELKVRKSRLIFFVIHNTVYFVRAFTKKTRKTPKNEIDLAEQIYKSMYNKLK
jgi:phage-related protein